MNLDEFSNSGAAHFPGAVTKHLPRLEEALRHQSNEEAGIRLRELGDLSDLLSPSGAIGRIATSQLGQSAKPVRAVLFNKTTATNWSLQWHQDRTICVTERIETDGFSNWTTKQGMLHVSPPASVLEKMVTLRVHLDPVPETNAPLLIALGTHRLGMVAENDVATTVAAHDHIACLAEAGDVWLYSTLILHASESALVPARRRVLQLDYAAQNLPNGLHWTGV